MEDIWELFVDKKLSGSTLIRRAYSDLNKVHLKWVIDNEGLTIQQWVDACCEQLKEEGHDLKKTSLQFVKLKFIKYDVSHQIPRQYIDLLDAKHMFLEKYAEMSNWDAPEEMLNEMKKSIDVVESGIKSLLR